MNIIIIITINTSFVIRMCNMNTTEKELVLEGKDAQNFESILSKKLSAKEAKVIEEAEALYKKHCRL